jgi:threonine synthase
MAQIPYYFYAAFKMNNWRDGVNFSVPTGNFGNIFAAYCAKKMGLPINKLIIATNENDIPYRFMQTNGHLKKGDYIATNSPSMDIQISSNFERLLFDASGSDPAIICQIMNDFKSKSDVKIPDIMMDRINDLFLAGRASQDETIETMRQINNTYNYHLDPHSAVGAKVALSYLSRGIKPIISLACAHPVKFNDAVIQAFGQGEDIPEHLAYLETAPEKFDILDNDTEQLKHYIEARL